MSALKAAIGWGHDLLGLGAVLLVAIGAGVSAQRGWLGRGLPGMGGAEEEEGMLRRDPARGDGGSTVHQGKEPAPPHRQLLREMEAEWD